MSSAAILHRFQHLPHSSSQSEAPLSTSTTQARQYTGSRLPSAEERWGSAFRDGLPTPPTTRDMTGSSLNSHGRSQSDGYSSMQNQYLPMYQAANVPASNVSAAPYHSSNGAMKVSEPSVKVEEAQAPASFTGQDSGYESKGSSSGSIATYLQIPSTINGSKGSLAEFAADITCLFWFESGTTLNQIEEANPYFLATLSLAPDSMPTMGFRKWVTTILSTTQVTQNVILLALLFIHRLKRFNPAVSGKRGSEFRLFTIALMLGNKFLDDNTYTNKTWAEVSGISVTEIHIMEVEFLSNMRYNLFVSEKQWDEWHKRLGRFWSFLETATKTSQNDVPKNSIPLIAHQASLMHKLPSPPSPVHSTTPYAYQQHSQPAYTHPLSLPSTLTPSPNVLYQEPEQPQSRKRSYDSSFDDRPAKRATGSVPISSSMLNPQPSQQIPTASDQFMNLSNSAIPQLAPSVPARVPRLPVPRLQTSISQTIGDGHALQLPLPTGRAMATVYPSSQPNWTQPTTPVGSAPPSTSIYSNTIPPLNELRNQQFATTPTRASPTGSSYAGLTPTSRLSPSYFLTNRNSPYRPVRNVHTLLNPPPSSSLQNPSRNISFDQMRYQPLSKSTNEQKAGVVPYLHQHDAWPQQAPIPPMNSQYAFPS